MNINYGNGPTEYGPGVSIDLDGNEVATAIDAWLVAHGVHVSGPRTITVNGHLCQDGRVYVDPSGFVITPDGEKMSGRGLPADETDPAPPLVFANAQPGDKCYFASGRNLVYMGLFENTQLPSHRHMCISESNNDKWTFNDHGQYMAGVDGASDHDIVRVEPRHEWLRCQECKETFQALPRPCDETIKCPGCGNIALRGFYSTPDTIPVQHI